MKPILVIAATSREISLLAGKIGCEPRPAPPFVVHEGKVNDRKIILAATGIGKVNTAACLGSLLQRYLPELLISTGCAGAFSGCGLDIGGIALSSSVVSGDEGVLTPAGWESLKLIGIPTVQKGNNRYFNEFPLCLTATARAMQLAVALGITVRRGRSVTVSTCSGTAARGEELKKRFNAISENMEGAAAAQVALIHGIKCMEIRGISNLVEDRDLSRWNIPLAVEEVQRFLFKFLETFPETPSS